MQENETSKDKQTIPMGKETKTTLKCIGLLVVGFLVNYGLSMLAAPDYKGTALAVGIFLTTFGMALAIFSMQIIMMPIGMISFLWQMMKGEKPIKTINRKRDNLDRMGRILFVCVYAMFSILAGVLIGALAGGMGLLATTAMFAIAGPLLALLAPQDLIWGSEGGNVATGMDTNERAQFDAARRKGDPSVVFADKLSSHFIDALVEVPKANDKSGTL